MIIRLEQPEERAAIAEVNRLAFGGEAEVQLVEAIRKSDRWLESRSFVAEVEGQVVGHLLLSPIDLAIEDPATSQTRLRERSLWALAPLAVHPQFQRQGIGSELVLCACAMATELTGLSYPAAIVVLGDPEFYARFGFIPSQELGLASPFEVPPESFRVKLLNPKKPLDRGKVVYPAAFSSVI